VKWEQRELGRWCAQVSGVECVLLMNDFPDEPLYTVEVSGERFDFDDAPASWTIPFVL
jgi:hypothetical protein